MTPSARIASVASCCALAAVLAGCPEKESGGGGGAGASTSPAAASSAQPAAAPASGSAVASATPPPPPPPCTTDAPLAIDKGARLETGLTAVELENGKKVAIGYAVGDGTPRVAIVDDTGAVTKADPDWGHVKDQEQKKDPAMVRHVHRVTPLGLAKNGKMKIGMDFLDAFPEKGKGSYLRCGPADTDPVISDDGGAQFDEPTEDDVAKLAAQSDTDGGTVDFRDCRTFGDIKRAFVLATQVKREGPGDDHNLLYQWVIDETPGKGMIKDAVIDKRVVKPVNGKYPKVEHFITPVAITMGDLGVLVTARDEGKIVFVKRTAKLEKAGSDPKAMWLGAAVGMPAIDMENGQAYILTTEFQKSDLYGVLFAATAAPEKPQKISLTDTNAPAAGEARDSASMDIGPTGDVAVTFVDGKAPQRRARMTVLGSDLKQKLPAVFDVTPPEANVSEARIVSLASNKFLVTYLRADGQVDGQIVSCKY